MKRTTCIAVVLVVALGAGSAFGQDCRKINIQFQEPAPYIDLTDPMYAPWVALIEGRFGVTFDPDNDWCWTQRAVGTIRGTWIACGKMDLSIFDPFGFGINTELWGNPGILITKRGYLFTMSYGVSKWADPENLSALGGVSYYEGATGRYEGMIGWATDRPMHYPPSFWVRSVGLICEPE
jgi:hypothetical protein